MSKQKKSRIQKLRKLSGAAQGELREKVAELEEEVREQKKTLMLGAIVFGLGLALGLVVGSKREK